MSLHLTRVGMLVAFAACSGSPPPPPPPPPPPHPVDLQVFRDPQATLDESAELAMVADLAGKSAFVELADGSRAVVTLRELEMHRDESGVTVATRLYGDVVWGGGDVKGINVDKRKLASERGWAPIDRFDGIELGVPTEGGPRFQFETLRFRTITANGFHMLVTSSMKGRTMPSGEALLLDQLAAGDLLCPATPVFKCTQTACGTPCRIVKQAGWIDDCECPDLIACHWIMTGTQCWAANCNGTCNNISGWAAFCPCI